MPSIEDAEFGTIQIRKSARSTRIAAKISLSGGLQISAPAYVPLFVLKRFVSSSRDTIRSLYDQVQRVTYQGGMQIGKSHTIIVRPATTLKIERRKLQIIVGLPPDMNVESTTVQQALKPSIIRALRLEAKGYLPKRLSYLADKYHFSYERVRFSHAGSRWGSCSSTGTISLNIALMKLPFELIDYVIIHELSHTIHLNHSAAFWKTVERFDPSYRTHRLALKHESPSI